MKTIKDFSQKILKQVEEIQIPALDNYLSTRYASSSSKYVCQYCEYVGKNQQAMSAHQRGCTIKKNIESPSTDENKIEIQIPFQEVVVVATPPEKEKVLKQKKLKL